MIVLVQLQQMEVSKSKKSSFLLRTKLEFPGGVRTNVRWLDAINDTSNTSNLLQLKTA